MKNKKEILNSVIEEISLLPQDWHGAGSVSRLVLEAIARYVSGMGEIPRSAETGSGKTTLLLSHLSRHHTVFARDSGQSISQVKQSPIFERDYVVFIEGPTQLTLPAYRFEEPLHLVLLDGPHGYPFPDLEYYYFYPHIREGGLLLVDDIQIPTIRRMFDIIEADDMFDLLEVVDNMAFFRRTAAAAFNPLGDGWWLQGYNKSMYEKMMAAEPETGTQDIEIQSHRLMYFLARSTPAFAKAVIPRKLKRRLLGK